MKQMKKKDLITKHHPPEKQKNILWSEQKSKTITEAWGVMDVEISEANRNMNNQNSLLQISFCSKKWCFILLFLDNLL